MDTHLIARIASACVCAKFAEFDLEHQNDDANDAALAQLLEVSAPTKDSNAFIVETISGQKFRVRVDAETNA